MSNSKEIKEMGIVLIVSGPSGSGKTSVCKNIMEECQNIYFSVSCTTRPPRKNEKHGQDYYFISHDEFKFRVEKNEFIEHAEVYGNCYGTLRHELVDKVKQGKDILLDIDVQGAMQIKKHSESDRLLASCLELVFIAPPNISELEKRLRGRNTETEETIKKRMTPALQELEFWREYDYLLINEDLVETVNEMKRLVDSIHKKTKHIKEFAFDAR
jgi:guanylate kinase